MGQFYSEIPKKEHKSRKSCETLFETLTFVEICMYQKKLTMNASSSGTLKETSFYLEIDYTITLSSNYFNHPRFVHF